MARPEQTCQSTSPSGFDRRVEGGSGPALAWIKAAEYGHITVCAHKYQLMKQRGLGASWPPYRSSRWKPTDGKDAEQSGQV